MLHDKGVEGSQGKLQKQRPMSGQTRGRTGKRHERLGKHRIEKKAINAGALADTGLGKTSRRRIKIATTTSVLNSRITPATVEQQVGHSQALREMQIVITTDDNRNLTPSDTLLRNVGQGFFVLTLNSQVSGATTHAIKHHSM